MRGHFLQSKEWEEFQVSVGREVFRIDDVLVTKLPLVFGKSYLYSAGIAHFQIFKFSNFQTLAKEYNAILLKIEPMVDDKSFAQELLRSDFKKSNKEVQPQKTIVLDLTKSEDELLKEMHQKTRYNIRLAQQKDLRFMIYDLRVSRQPLDRFWQILCQTSARDTFHAHPKEYYQKLLEQSAVRLCGIEYEDGIIAANIILLYGSTVYYLHGASDYEHRNLMAPYLLHWEIIKYAKAQDLKEYDLWGIDEKKWPGVTRFKRGFGGREVEYIGSYNYVFQPFWYRAYNLRHLIKNIIKR